MLLNWQGRHFMEINHSRITSYEIADYMIRTKSLLSAKELAAILEKEYPHLDVDKRDVYLRLKAIAVSKYSSVLIDDSTRPRRFQIHSLNPEFFRRSRAPRRFDEKLQNELYMTQDERNAGSTSLGWWRVNFSIRWSVSTVITVMPHPHVSD